MAVSSYALLSPKPSLLIVQVSGDALYPDWYPQWALDYALLHAAIIVTPNYRLLPESIGADINDDINDFWTWVRTSLQSLLAPQILADFSKILAHGESAGGALAIQSSFSQPAGFVKATISTYPTINFTPKRIKPILGVPTILESVLEEHLKAIVPGQIVTSAFPPARMNIALSIMQQSRLLELWGDAERMDLKLLLDSAQEMPCVLILHGSDDSAVPVEGSVEWVAEVEKRFGNGKIELCIQPGEHGFDVCSLSLY